ncbi:MAG: hypothetical protein U0W24_22295 [Bacteroidales bacterium]
MKEILDLIGNDQLDEAIKILLEKSIKIDDIQKELILLQARLADLKRDSIKGIVKDEDENLQKNQIRNALIELTFNLKKKVQKQTSRKKILDITFSFSLVFNIAITINLIICKCDCIQNEEKLDAIAKFMLREADDLFKRKHCYYAYTKYVFVRDKIRNGKIDDNLKYRIEECKTCTEQLKKMDIWIYTADSLVREEKFDLAINKFREIIIFNNTNVNGVFINKKLERKLKGFLNTIDIMLITAAREKDIVKFKPPVNKRNPKEVSGFEFNEYQIKLKGNLNLEATDIINYDVDHSEKEKKAFDNLDKIKNKIKDLLQQVEMSYSDE